MIVDSCFPLNPARLAPDVWGGRVWLEAVDLHGPNDPWAWVPRNGYVYPPGAAYDAPDISVVGEIPPHSLALVEAWSQTVVKFKASVPPGYIEVPMTALSELEYAALAAWCPDHDVSGFGLAQAPRGLELSLEVRGSSAANRLGSLRYGENASRVFLQNDSPEAAPVRLSAAGWVRAPGTGTPGDIYDGLLMWTARVYTITDPGLLDEYYKRGS